MEPAVDAELGVLHEPGEGVTVVGARSGGPEESSFAHGGIGDLHGMQFRGYKHVRAANAVVEAMDRQNIGAISQE